MSRFTASVALLAFVAATLLTGSSSASAPTCLGEAATIVGTGGPDSLIGTPGHDVVAALAGDDTVRGLGGDDLLCGGSGRDTAAYAGATGGVTVDLSAGNASGGAGDDSLAGIEAASGWSGADRLVGNGGANALSGLGGDDVLIGGGGPDLLAGGAGVDTARYSTATLGVTVNLALGTSSGGAGMDTITGVENVAGSRAADSLTGNAGANGLSGGAGDDLLTGGPGPDMLAGGLGDDRAGYAGAAAAVSVNLATGAAVGGGGSDSLSGIEDVTGSGFADLLVGSGLGNTIAGGGGNDKQYGRGGADTVAGGLGDDKLYGEAGDDALMGGPDDDYLDGGSGTNTCDGGTGADTLLNSCDSTPPVLTAFSFSPTSIDTSGSEQTVHVTAHITDNLSGEKTAFVNFYPPCSAFCGSPQGDLARVSGTPLDGSYEGDVTFPRYSPQGTWKAGVVLVDAVQNDRQLTANDLADLGFPSTVEQTGPGDLEAPVLADLSFSPSSIDTSAGEQTVHVTAHITDDTSGLKFGSYVQFRPPCPCGDDRSATFVLTSGTSLDGIYEADVTFPRYSPQVTYTADVTLVDNADREHNYPKDALAALGFPTTVEQTGEGDEEAPVLTAFSFSPSHIDTASGPQTVHVTAHVTENLSGVHTAYVRFRAPCAFCGWPEASFVRITGTALDGDYEADVVFPQFSPYGTYHADVVVADVIQNDHEYVDELETLGFPFALVNGP